MPTGTFIQKNTSPAQPGSQQAAEHGAGSKPKTGGVGPGCDRMAPFGRIRKSMG
jgi:hypothetical protein